MYEIDWPAQRRRKGGESRSGERSSAARRSRPPRPGLRSGATSSAMPLEEPLALVRAGRGFQEPAGATVQVTEIEAALLGALDDPARKRDRVLHDGHVRGRGLAHVGED